MKCFSRVSVLAVSVLLVLLLPSCVKNPTEPVSMNTLPSNPSGSLQKVVVTENFESGTKTAYAAANVTLGSGVWNLNDALLGTSTSDRKNGSQSVRARNSAKVTMTFNTTTGAGVVTVAHALYGSDGSSTWQLWYSTNSGSSWTQTGSTVTTSSTTLQTASFTVNIAGTIRFEIRKTDGSANRINFDDFVINDYSGGGGGSSSEHTILGNPSGAVHDINYPTNYLMEKPQYVICYNNSKSEPNWVAWHLSSSWLGSAARQDDFRADTSLPAGWYQVQGTSYSGSGYDRGHMCPSADRTSTVANNSATFLMTNMLPQAANNNQGPWAVLEDSCRALVSKGCELYIYSGGYGSQGTINNGHVNVPTYTWKVVVVLTSGDNDLGRVTTSTRVIGVWMPNSDSQISRTANWKTFRVSVDYIESQTGYDFLSNVSTSIQSTIESRVDSM
jgi:endonuclease G, mitochondrial